MKVHSHFVLKVRCSMSFCLQNKNILILEGEVFTGIDIATCIMDVKGIVTGPIASINDAMRILENNHIDAAIVDITLTEGQADPILDKLVEQNRLVIIHSRSPLPTVMLKRYANIQYYFKPTPTYVLRHALLTGLTAN